MNKNAISLIAGLLALSACSSAPAGKTELSDIDVLLASLKGTSHTLSASNEVYVNQVYEESIDQYLKMESTITFSYANNGERAYKISKKQINADLVKGTKEIQTNDQGEPIFTTYDLGTRLYFRDQESGVVLFEGLDLANKVTTYIESEYDYTGGIYTPILFDDEFRNPFDYFHSGDIQKTEEAHTYRLNAEKASFALTSYGITGGKVASGALIKTGEDGKVASIDFEIPSEGGEGYTYSRSTTYSVNVVNIGESSTLSHVVPLTNDNPKLKQALQSLENAQSYRYSKSFYSEEGELQDNIMGYFTQDAAFYHHHDSPKDKYLYEEGDDYDYMAAKCEANNKYYGFSWQFGLPSWSWSLEMVSSSAAYSIESFSGLGPRLSEVASEVFTLKEGTDNVYIIEDDTIRKGAGAYFDFQFLGVNSAVLETNTSKLEITLEEDGSFTVDTGFSYAEHGYTQTTGVVYHLDASSINSTTLPSYVSVPDTTGLEQY